MEVKKMMVNKEMLQYLRKKAPLSQEGLAEVSGLSKKTIARMEAGKGEPRGDTVSRLAKALGVKPDLLFEAPDSEKVKGGEMRMHGYLPMKGFIESETQVAYDLVADRYGINMKKLIDVAPLLFTLLAEMSLAERHRRLLEEKKNYYEDFPKYLIWGADRDLGLSAEDGSLGARDLFGQIIVESCDTGSGAFEEYFFENCQNPFTDFLIEQAKSLGPDNEAIEHEKIDYGYSFDELPRFRLFESYREKLTGGSARADYALSRPYVRIPQIPAELRGEDEDVTSERVKWLEERVPEEDWIKDEKWNAEIPEIMGVETYSKSGEFSQVVSPLEREMRKIATNFLKNLVAEEGKTRKDYNDAWWQKTLDTLMASDKVRKLAEENLESERKIRAHAIKILTEGSSENA